MPPQLTVFRKSVTVAIQKPQIGADDSGCAEGNASLAIKMEWKLPNQLSWKTMRCT